MNHTPNITATKPADELNRRQCCVHIGLPKTATTTLQRELFPAHRQLEYLGKVPGEKEYFDSQIGAVLNVIDKISIKPEKVAEYADRMASEYLTLPLEDLRGHGENGINPYTDAQLLLSLSLALSPVSAGCADRTRSTAPRTVDSSQCLGPL